MQRIIEGKVSVILTIATVVVAVVAGIAGGMYYARDTIYDYTVAVNARDGTHEKLQYGVWPELANANFFSTVRDSFIAEKASFVEANLTAMTITVYRSGASVLTVPIKSKGKEGSWWETPSGLYRAQGKEKEHFSSFGHVYMPWSIPFQGNFFIHGWPYHADGTPVPEGYSGGCMRLENEYAKQVYDLVEVGMPILVFEEEPRDTSYAYAINVPDISAASYLVADLENNFVLLAGAQDAARETPLVPRMLTALVASEYQNIEKEITVDEDMLFDVPHGRLAVGETYSLYDLFFPLLMEHAPGAARVLSGYFGKKRFLGLMQAKVAALGMKHTDLTDPAGLVPGNTTTAEDVFLFLKYLELNRPFVLSMSTGATKVATYGEPRFTDIVSLHPLHTDRRFRGGASEDVQETVAAAQGEGDALAAALMLAFASTSAPVAAEGGDKKDLLTVLTIPFGGRERPVAFIVLDSPDPAGDTRTMVSYVERMYR